MILPLESIHGSVICATRDGNSSVKHPFGS